MSVVYILTNQSMPGIVKIGITGGTVEERMRSLYSTGVPLPFECYFALEVDDSSNIEKKLHHGLDDFRVNDSREFFEMKKLQMSFEYLIQFVKFGWDEIRLIT